MAKTTTYNYCVHGAALNEPCELCEVTILQLECWTEIGYHTNYDNNVVELLENC